MNAHCERVWPGSYIFFVPLSSIKNCIVRDMTKSWPGELVDSLPYRKAYAVMEANCKELHVGERGINFDGEGLTDLRFADDVALKRKLKIEL